MSTIAMTNDVVMNSNASKRMTLVDRFKKYILENADTLGAAGQTIAGNPTAVKSIMEARENR